MSSVKVAVIDCFNQDHFLKLPLQRVQMLYTSIAQNTYCYNQLSEIKSGTIELKRLLNVST